MNKEKIISYIEDLEDKANQSDEYLIERTEAHIKVKHLQSVIDKAIEVFENEIKNRKEQKRLIMNILTPENGYLKADIDYEIKRLERYLEILRSK